MSSRIEEDYVTVPEAADLLNVSQSTIWRWIDQGDVPAYRIGQRRVRLRKADLTSLITPARRRQEKGGGMVQTERLKLGSLTRKEQQQGLAAIESAKQLQAEMLIRRGGKPFTPSYAILDELRDQRTEAHR